MSPTAPNTFVLVLIGLVAMATGQATDLTMVPESAGQAVVTATLARIHESCVFRNDFLFLRRLAYVLSRNGLDPQTYTDDFHGGIWQVKETHHNETKYLASIDYSKIEEAFNIDWAETQWSDLRKPLYSGIAAMITLEHMSEIPSDVQSQANFYSFVWSENATKFINEVSGLGIDCKADNLDMAFLIDASGSISSSEYAESKRFTANVIRGFNIGMDAVRVAVTSFSTPVDNHFYFKDHNTSVSAMQDVLSIPKSGRGTNTEAGLDNIREVVFTQQRGSRKDAARIVIVQTDGESDNTYRTTQAAKRLKDEGVIVFAIGIGDGVDTDELNAIASYPTCTHVRLLKDFKELDSIVSDIKEAACKTEIVQETKTTNNYTCSGQKTIKVVLDKETSIVTRPEMGQVAIFGSFDITEPNAALSDFSGIAADGKPVVIYVSNADKPLYLNIDVLDSKEDQCDSTFLVKIVDSNALKKTGASNLCVKDAEVQDCTDLDYVKSGNFSKVNDSSSDKKFERLCGQGAVGYRPHPEMATKYVYCAEEGEVYVVNCPDGFAYLESQQDCAAPASLEGDAVCKVCSADNWELGFRNFPLPSSKQRYVKCTGVEQCEKEECDQASHYLPDDQKCSDPDFNSAHVAGVSFISFSLSLWAFYFVTA